MRLGLIPQSVSDGLALATGALPIPLVDTMITTWLARTIMVGTKLGVFEALADGARSAAEIAAVCGTHPHATEKLLTALTGAAYLRFDDGRFALAPVARKWLLARSARSLRDAMLAMFWYWELIEHYEEFVRTGLPLDLHAHLDADTWALYQRGMRANASLSAREIGRRVPVPLGATSMLDLGGSHGLYSVAICRRHPELRSTIIDLPEALAHAAPLLAAEGAGDTVVHRAGDVRTLDLGEEAHDVVFAANLVHHFDAATNRALAQRVARALRPGGYFVILEIIRPATPDAAGQIGALADLYFSTTSDAGTWSAEDIQRWQRNAGLRTRKPVWLVTIPGHALVIARKRRVSERG